MKIALKYRNGIILPPDDRAEDCMMLSNKISSVLSGWRDNLSYRFEEGNSCCTDKETKEEVQPVGDCCILLFTVSVSFLICDV